MLSFTTAHAAVIALRIKDPDRERPYRIGVNIRFRGAAIPISAVIGGIGTFAAWVSVLALHVDARYVGTGWMVVGLIGYVHLPAQPGARPDQPSQDRAARAAGVLRRARVPLGDRPDLRHRRRCLGAAGRRQARRRGRDGRGGVRAARPQPAVARRRARGGGAARAERAGERQARRRKSGLKVQTRLIRTRSPGAAIVEEAQRRKAEIIYLGTAHAPPSERALGPTAALPARPPAVPRGYRDAAGDRLSGAASGANLRPAPAPEPVARAPRRVRQRANR